MTNNIKLLITAILLTFMVIKGIETIDRASYEQEQAELYQGIDKIDFSY